MNPHFKDRTHAGQLLAGRLKDYKDQDAIVLAVPRGGVVIGYEIARALHLPLSLVLAKKIGHPSNPEFAVGSVSLDSVVLDEHPDVSRGYVEKEIVRIREQLRQKQRLYLGDTPPP